MANFIVHNRVPEPNETQVPLAATVQVDISDPDLGDFDLAVTSLYLQGVLVFQNGVFQAGYNGVGSVMSTPQADTLRLVVAPDVPFESLEVVTVRLLSNRATSSDAPLDVTWIFTAVDLTAPRLVTAVAISQTVVRLSFDEPIRQTGEDAGDAHTISNYTFERLNHPAVTLRPVSTTVYSTTSMEVTVQWPMTPGRSYRISVQNVEDLFGNVILAPFNTVVFEGFRVPVPENRRFSLWQFMPKKWREWDDAGTGDLRLWCAVLQEPLDLMMWEIDRFLAFLDPDTASEEWIDVMLQDMGNPFKFPDLTLNKKRRLLTSLKLIAKQGGSPQGIKNVIRLFLDLDVEIVAFEDSTARLGEAILGYNFILGAGSAFAAYAFNIVSPRVLTVEERKQVRAIGEYVKAGWEHFVYLREPGQVPPDPLYNQLGVSQLGYNFVLR